MNFLFDILTQRGNIQLDNSFFAFWIFMLRMDYFIDCDSHF